MNYRFLFIFFLLFIVHISDTCAQVHKITFMPHWLPQAQFAGYYVAQQKGFYEKEGIEVDIVHPSASMMVTDYLVKGKADVISLFLVSALTSIDKGVKMVNIAQLSQNSGMLFVTRKDKNIKTIKDLDGKKIGIWQSGFDEIPKGLIRSQKINVEWVPILSSVNLFMLDGIDAMTVMWYNEYDQIINSGYNADELNTFFFSKYGYNIPEDGLYCLEKNYSGRRTDLTKFVNGSLKGWEYAKAHPEEALDIVLDVMKKEHVATNYAHQKWMLETVLQLMVPSDPIVRKGQLAEPDYQKTLKAIMDSGLLHQAIPYHDFYKPVL